MGEVFEIKTVGQLRLFNTPETRGVFEAMLDIEGGESAREIGIRCAMSPESVHYHLGKLTKLGLAEEVGVRGSGARPERLFGLRYRSAELKKGKRSKAYIKELVRGVQLFLRKSGREYERAWQIDLESWARPRVIRSVGWLSAEDIHELELLEERLYTIFSRADRAHQENEDAHRERVAITITLTSIE
ncbi:MAG: hypothetical protein ACWA5W_09495 [Phycisphaerales bacterium]